MQSIEEAAHEYINNFPPTFYNGIVMKKRAFKAGVEFAQRWIPVEEELPIAYESGDWTGRRSDLVLCKLENNKYCIARLYSGQIDGFKFDDWVDSDDNFLVNKKVIEWKPIELK